MDNNLYNNTKDDVIVVYTHMNAPKMGNIVIILYNDNDVYTNILMKK